MSVFIDYVFLENIVYNFVIILQTAFLSRVDVKKRRFVFASTIGSIYVCIMVCLSLDFFNYFWCKLLLSFVIVYIAFIPQDIGKYLKLIGIYYLATIINVGGCVFVSQMIVKEKEISITTKVIIYIISLLITYLYTKEFWKIYKNNISKNHLIQKVTLNISRKRYTYLGFLDTGNTVKCYELGVPVIFAEYLNNEQKEIIEKQPKYNVNVSTISKQSQEKVILVEQAVIGGKLVDVGVVFVDKKLNKNNEYNMILNYELFENKLGGIKI